jgi:hypothetical protein
VDVCTVVSVSIILISYEDKQADPAEVITEEGSAFLIRKTASDQQKDQMIL